jgi:hypothetical protein
VRYDITDLDDSDVFFASTDDTATLAGGVRYDYASWSALKLQYDTTATSPSGGGSDVDSSRLALQVSFAF